MSSNKWNVVVEPRGDNDQETPEKNTGGMVIYLQQGTSGPKQEVTRVAFARRNSKNPKDSFKTRMKREHAKAQEAADFANAAIERATADAGSLA